MVRGKATIGQIPSKTPRAITGLSVRAGERRIMKATVVPCARLDALILVQKMMHPVYLE